MRKSLIMLAFLMLLLSTLACNLSSDDADFFICERTGGEWVDPEFSIDGWCRYPYDPDIEESNSRMATHEAEFLPDESMQQEEDESEGKSEPVPVGTYIGENLEIPPDWELVEGEFIIEVAEDGTVSGSRIYIIKLETVGTTCTWRRENGHSTSFSGHISDVTIENESYTISDSSDCGGSNIHKTYESVCDDAQITISGEQMEISGDGSSNCGFVFKATKQ